MAHKYDLLTVDTNPSEPKKHYPWYKERLRQKFLKTSRYCTTLDGARWRFISSNIDDFRSGAPVRSHKMVLKRQVNPVPIVEKKSLESSPKSSSTLSTPGMIMRNPGHRTLFSKKGARQQIKQEHIDSVERSLLQHPLALYPHLEDGIASELADDIVDILDPDINEMLSSSEGSISISASQAAQPNLSKMECTSRSSRQILIHAPSTIDGDEIQEVQESRGDPAIMYRFPLIKTEAEKEQEMNLIASQQVVSAKQQSRVKQVTHDLVKWAEELGGSEKSAYIDEQTIKSLFGSNYESKPILMAPIQVVELTSVPQELRTDSRCRSANTASSQQKGRKSPDNYYGYHRSKGTQNWPSLETLVPQVVRSKYGNWYLPVELWKLRSSDEPLKDPDLDGGALEQEQATRKLEMDERISTLHGAKLFKEFVGSINKEGIMPSFLNSVMLHTPPPGHPRKK